MKYKCKENSEHNRFRANVLEHVEWIIADDGEYLEQGECYESKIIDVQECAICGGGVEVVE